MIIDGVIMARLKRIESAKHIEEISYAVRGPLDRITEQIEAEGEKVVKLHIGDPATHGHETPIQLREIILETLKNEKCLHYGHSMGVPELREIIAKNSSHIMGFNGMPVSRDDVGIGEGSTGPVDFCIGALLNPGDEILIPDPGYPMYEAIIRKYHGVPKHYSLIEEKNWGLDISELEKKVTKRTRAIVVINPGNPTGRNYDEKTLQDIRRFADKHGLMIFADEVYSFLNYDGKKHCPLATLEGEYPVITFGSLSKNYLSPGLRVGWMIRADPNGLTQDYWAEVSKLASIRLCSAPLLQYALKPAFEDGRTRQHTLLKKGVDTFVKKMKRNAELTYDMLNNPEAGISCVRPEACFYALPKIDIPEGVTDFDFARDLLIHRHIQVNNGSGFGPSGKGHIRIVFLPDYDTLKEVYEKIIDFKMNFMENGKRKYMR